MQYRHITLSARKVIQKRLDQEKKPKKKLTKFVIRAIIKLYRERLTVIQLAVNIGLIRRIGYTLLDGDKT